MNRLPRCLVVLLGLIVLLWCGAAVPAGDEKKPEPAADSLPSGARLRLGSGRFRHGGAVYRIYALPDGKRLLTLADDRKARVWDLATGKELVQFPFAPLARYEKRICAIAPDGETLALADDRTIRILTLADGKERLAIPERPETRNLADLAYSADSKMLVTSHWDHTYRLWDAATGKELRVVRPPPNPDVDPPVATYVRLLPNGKTLAIITDRVVSLLDLETGKEQRSFGGHSGRVAAFTFSPDGKQMATVAGDGTARLWDLTTGKSVAKLPIPAAGNGSDLAFSADGKMLAIVDIDLVQGDPDRTLRLFDVAGARQLLTFDLGRGSRSSTFALTPDGKSVYVSKNTLILQCYDTATGKELLPFTGHTRGVGTLVWSPDGKTLATGGQRTDHSILFWDARSGALLHRLAVPKTVPNQMQFAPDGKTLLSLDYNPLGYNGIVRSWRVAEGKELSSFVTPRPEEVAVSLDGKLAAMPDGREAIRVWDVAAQKQLHRLEVKLYPREASFQLLFAGDNRTLLVYHPDQHRLRRWDAVTGRELDELKDVAVNFFPLPPQQRDGYSCLPYQGSTITELATGKVRQRLTMPPNVTVRQAALSPDGRTVAAILSDGTLRFWDTGSGLVLTQLKDLAALVGTLAFAPDSKTLATAGADGAALLWDVPGLDARGRSRVIGMAADTAAAMWSDLSVEDAAHTWREIYHLVSYPKYTLPLVQKELASLVPSDEKQIAQWIADLDADEFSTREDATDALIRTGRAAEGAVRKALEKQPSAEAKQRLQAVLAKLADRPRANRERLRALRAIEVLEMIGTPDTQKLLEEIAKGADGPITAAARSARERLKMRTGTP